MRAVSRKMTMSCLVVAAGLTMAPAGAAAPAQPNQEGKTMSAAGNCDSHYITNPAHAMTGPNGTAEITAEGDANLPDPSTYISVVVMRDQGGIDAEVARSPEGQADGQLLQAHGPWPGSGTYYTQLQDRGSILCSGPHVNL